MVAPGVKNTEVPEGTVVMWVTRIASYPHSAVPTIYLRATEQREVALREIVAPGVKNTEVPEGTVVAPESVGKWLFTYPRITSLRGPGDLS